MTWKNAREEFPPDEGEVLVCTRSRNGTRNIDKGYWFVDRWIHRGSSEVTHWMPLPPLPDDGAEDEREHNRNDAYTMTYPVRWAFRQDEGVKQ